MHAILRLPLLPFFAAALALLAGPLAAQDIALPAPRGHEVDITRILAARRDTTAFSPSALSAQAVSDLLWASTGINRPLEGKGTSNYSYSVRNNDVYLLCAQGVFVYDQLEHGLTRRSDTDLRPMLGGAATNAPATFALVSFSGSLDSEGAVQTGFIAENIAFACADRGLGAHLTAEVPTGLAAALGLASAHKVLLLQTVGFPEGTPVITPAWSVAAGALVPAAVNDAPALKILKRRRSTRNQSTTPFPLQTLAELAWAGIGVNGATSDERTSPLIAGAHDIDLYVATATGVYRYRPAAGTGHDLQQLSTGDIRAGFGANAAVFIYVSDYAKLPAGANKQRLAWLHAGLVSQNIAAYTAAEGLGELVRSSLSVPSGPLHLNTTDPANPQPIDQHILFTQTLGYMATPPGPSTVTLSAGAGGTVTGPAAQSIAFGSAGTAITAIPNSGYRFAYWTGLPGGRVPANPLPLANVTCAMNIAAVFAPVPTTYATWRALHFSGPDLADDTISGMDADPDGAGISNLLRYAHDLPARGPANLVTTLGSREVNGQKVLTLTFPRRSAGEGLYFHLDASTDLRDWEPIEFVPAGEPSPYTALDNVPVDDPTTPRRFLRVRVTQTQ